MQTLSCFNVRISQSSEKTWERLKKFGTRTIDELWHLQICNAIQDDLPIKKSFPMLQLGYEQSDYLLAQ